MAATSQDYQRLPPSPPPSPPRHRHPKKHQKDPFLELSETAALNDCSCKDEEQQDSLVSRLFWTPLLFTSFLLSLFLINRSDRQSRLHSHPTSSSSPSLLSYLSPSSWIDPEPYQSPSSTAWDRRNSSGHVEPHPTIGNNQTKKKTRSWHLHKKIRKVARLEISDAFEMQWSLFVVLLSVVVLFGVGVFVGMRWMWVRMWGGR